MSRRYTLPATETIRTRLKEMRGADPYHAEYLHPILVEKLRRPSYDNILTAYLIVQEMDAAIDQYSKDSRIVVPGVVRHGLLMKYMSAIFRERRLIREATDHIASRYPAR